jgi:hypothetical protein
LRGAEPADGRGNGGQCDPHSGNADNSRLQRPGKGREAQGLDLR